MSSPSTVSGKEKRPPQLVIFDLGNVVFRLDWQPLLAIWSAASGVPAARVAERLRGFDALDEFDRGQVSPADFHRRFCVWLGADFSYADFERGWNAIYDAPMPGIGEMLAKLRTRARVVGFTNTNIVHCRVWPELYRAELAHFERIFVSCEMGLRKPEPESYAQVLGQCGVTAAEAAFFDDTRENVAAAQALGIRSVLVDSPEAVTAGLAQFGLL
ncbi:MAG: HAD-IA family hydrolase [Opitutae bacterium]|nr:HAD-IA family hydrolase [Opitutae bacterium]